MKGGEGRGGEGKGGEGVFSKKKNVAFHKTQFYIQEYSSIMIDNGFLLSSTSEFTDHNRGTLLGRPVPAKSNREQL